MLLEFHFLIYIFEIYSIKILLVCNIQTQLCFLHTFVFRKEAFLSLPVTFGSISILMIYHTIQTFYQMKFAHTLLHPATQRGDDQAVMPTPQGRLLPPSHQGGGAWSMVSISFSLPTCLMILCLLRDVIGDSALIGDTRWAGSFGVSGDFIARDNCR